MRAALCLMAAPLLAQIISIRQDAVPEMLVPSTQTLLYQGPVSEGATLKLFRRQGEGVEFSKDGQWVAYDTKHRDGYYNIHISRPDGTLDRCLTCGPNGLPHRHAGSPTWHASGKYVAFAAEKAVHPGGSIEAIPGFGGHSDIWVILADGTKAWQLTHTGDTKNDGVIIPKFSHDGKKLSWTERIGATKFLQPKSWLCEWVIKVADFIDSPSGPRLENIRTFQPGVRGFYEAYGFSPDDRQIIFSSDMESRSAWQSQIYTINAADGTNPRRLTEPNCYNEHASYSPDGRFIVWMSNKDSRNAGTDWWIMRADGSDKRRLTHFNSTGYPESTARPVYAVLAHWAPNGRQFLGGVQYSLIKQEGRIFLITLPEAR